MPEIIGKDPSAIKDYGFDWSRWLSNGETISTSVWTTTPGITKLSSGLVEGGITVIWVKGGTLGCVYKMTNHIVTNQGREDSRSIFLKIGLA